MGWRIERSRRGVRGNRAWLGVVLGAFLAPACGDGRVPGSVGPPPMDMSHDSSPDALAGVAFFDDSLVHDVRLEMSPEDWKSIVDDSRGDEYRHATFSIDGAVLTNIGVRPSGESSRVPGNPKMSVRVQFDAFRDGLSIGGVDSIKLSGSWDDPFIVRDRLAYWFFRQVMPAPREVAAQLTVNGQPNGAYEIEEHWDRAAIKQHFQEPFGSLYRLRGMIGSDPFAYKGPDAAAYVPLPWDPVGNHPSEDHLEIGRALDVLANDPANLGQVMNLDSVLDYFAGNALLANTDGFTGELEVDDFYEYFDPPSGLLFMLPWDPDNTFGSLNDPPDRDIFKNFDKSVITRLLRDAPWLRALFLNKLDDWMARVPVEAIQAQADAIYAQVRPGAAADTLKQYPTEHFDWSLGYVKDFIAARYASVRAQTAAYRVIPPAGDAGGAPVPPDPPPQDPTDTPPGTGAGNDPPAGGTP